MTFSESGEPADQAHATCAEVDGVGILITGPSGSGKSDLTLRLMQGGAQLVADDRVDLSIDQTQIIARAPKALRGLLEVREIGIVKVPFLEQAVIRALIELKPGQILDRLPTESFVELLGIRIRQFQIDPWQQSAPAKVRLVTQLITGSIVRIDD